MKRLNYTSNIRDKILFLLIEIVAPLKSSNIKEKLFLVIDKNISV